MKIRELVLSIFVLFIANLLTAQETRPSFLNKTNQHSVSAEYTAISYSYAHKFKQNTTFGARVQVGYGRPITLANTTIRNDFGNEPVEVKAQNSSLEILKFQLFYRHSISNSFYFDVGPFASISVLVGEGWENPYKVGAEVSVYYSIWKMHLGLRINGAMRFYISNPNVTRTCDPYYVLDVVPLVIGFNF